MRLELQKGLSSRRDGGALGRGTELKQPLSSGLERTLEWGVLCAGS